MNKKNGHIFIELGRRRICYTKGEFRRLHLHFFHPSSSILFALVKKESPQESGSDRKRTIDEFKS